MAPSFRHQGLVDLFQHRPSLAPELIRDALLVPIPDYDDVRIESADLRDLTPAELHADLVVLLVRDSPVLAIIVEVQLRRDEAKRFSWPSYIVGIRRRFSCDACVLVIAPNNSVAKWARQPIELGPGGRITPLVLGPDAVPAVRDIEQAVARPELAVLSAIAHGLHPEMGKDVAFAAAAAARRVDSDHSMLYLDLIVESVSDAVRSALENVMQTHGYVPRNKVLRRIVTDARVEGRVEAKNEDVIRVLEARKLVVSPEQRTRITSCTHLSTLDRWLVRAATVGSTDEIFSRKG